MTILPNGILLLWSIFNTPDKFVIAFRDTSTTPNFGMAKVGRITESSLVRDNFYGISAAAYADGATATIKVTGSTAGLQSSLTVGSKYYVQPTGTLSTTPGRPATTQLPESNAA